MNVIDDLRPHMKAHFPMRGASQVTLQPHQNTAPATQKSMSSMICVTYENLISNA